MTAKTNYETDIDGVHLTVEIQAETEGESEQDPAVVREFVSRISEAVETRLFELEKGQ